MSSSTVSGCRQRSLPEFRSRQFSHVWSSPAEITNSLSSRPAGAHKNRWPENGVFPGSSIRDNPNRSDAFNWLPEDLDGETALLFRIALAPFAGSADADEGFSSGNILTA
jgi:hypothetical protein